MNKQKIISIADKLSLIGLLGLSLTFFSKALSEIFTVTAIVGWWMTQFDARYRKFWKKIPLASWLCVGALIVWGLFVSAISDYPQDSFASCFTKWGEWIFLSFACFSILSINKRWLICLKALMWGSGIIMLDGVYQIVFGQDLLRGHPMVLGIYPTASFSYYTGFAAYLAVFFILGVGLNLQPILSRKYRVLLTVHNALSLSLLLLTYSRGAWLGAFCGLVLISIWREKKLLYLWALSLGPLFYYFREQLLFRFEQPFALSAFGYRPEMWADTIEIIKVAPWTGIGVNNFSKWIHDFSSLAGYAHNSYLQFTAEIGWIGVSIFLSWILGLMVWASRRTGEKTQSAYCIAALVCALSGFMVHAFFDSLFYNTTLALLFGLLLGLAAVTAIPEEQILGEGEPQIMDEQIKKMLNNPSLKRKVSQA